jgi:hypothetical protein
MVVPCARRAYLRGRIAEPVGALDPCLRGSPPAASETATIRKATLTSNVDISGDSRQRFLPRRASSVMRSSRRESQFPSSIA